MIIRRHLSFLFFPILPYLFVEVLIVESKFHGVKRIFATPIRDVFRAIFFMSKSILINK